MLSTTYPRRPRRKGDLWIMQVPVISTSHFPADDCDLLFDAQATCLVGFNDEIPTAILHLEDFEQNLPLDRLAESSRQVLRHFHDLGYAYLRLDRDGDVVPGLPTFDW